MRGDGSSPRAMKQQLPIERGKMKKTAFAATLVASAMVLAGCATGGTTTQPTSPAATAESAESSEVVFEAKVLKLGHAGSETDPRQTASLRLAELVAEATGGAVTIEIYPASTLGSWEEMVEGLQLGTVDIVIESLLAVESYTPLAGVETAPFLYSSQEQFFEVWNGALGDEIKSSIAEATGYEFVGNMFRGARQLTTKDPVASLADVQGMTIRTPSAQTMVNTWNELGTRAEPMAFNEVYSAIESGVLDGQENPLDAILFNSIHEVAPFIGLTSHMYANYHFITWGDAMSNLQPELQAVLRELMVEVGNEYTVNTVANLENYRAQLEEQGATFTVITDIGNWVQATEPLIQNLDPTVQGWVAQIRG